MTITISQTPFLKLLFASIYDVSLGFGVFDALHLYGCNPLALKGLTLDHIIPKIAADKLSRSITPTEISTFGNDIDELMPTLTSKFGHLKYIYNMSLHD